MVKVSAKEFGVNLAKRMKRNLPFDSVACRDLSTYGDLSDMVSNSGDGNYLEIGTWRGASAIVAARTKVKFGLGGHVYCVDHFKGYRNENIGSGDAVKNIKRYRVASRVSIIVSSSRPFPINNKRFSCALIDGNHWGEEPYLDFVKIEGMVDKYILMDDYDHERGHTVIDCVDRILAEFNTWKIKNTGNSCVLLERISND